MQKLDLTKKYKSYYQAKEVSEIVVIESAQFLSIRGKGDPFGTEFGKNVEALYATAYAIKFAFKQKDKDFVVAKLEGQWWFDEQQYTGLTMTESSQKVPRTEWEYRLLIRLPDYVDASDVHKAIETVIVKKKLNLARKVEFYEMSEGQCVQILHLGPFSAEPVSLEKMKVLIKANAFAKNGHHHEIYLSDPRKIAPEKLRTILREPVK